MFRSGLLALIAALSSALALPTPAFATEPVDLELILMADGSGSIDDEEFILQRWGYARALRSPRIIKAIRGGPLGRIALSYVEWSGPDLHIPIVPWTVIRTAAEIEAFARILETHPRALDGGGTAIGDAILYGARSLRDNAFDGTRLVIDLSGDGPDKNGLPAIIGRDAAVADGITVNGLPILDSYYRLDDFFRDNVIGGRGAFSVPARNFEDVYFAIRRKLILEIAGKSGKPSPASVQLSGTAITCSSSKGATDEDEGR